MAFLKRIKNKIRDLAYTSQYAHLFCFQYKFQYQPPNLCLLYNLLVEATKASGSVVEAGCFQGATTIWLCKALEALEIHKNYYALDTFSGFVEEHINYESTYRGKNKAKMMSDFSINSQKWFDRTMSVNNITNVISIQTDISTYDFSSLGEICFALIDVDLYIPVSLSLKQLYPLISPGGIIAVDDCQDNRLYDGALQAYKEFVDQNQLPFDVMNNKIGIIRKPLITGS